MSLDYSRDGRSLLEKVTEEASKGQLFVETFVNPDGVIVSDGNDTVRVSKGKEKETAFVEVDGEGFHISTMGGSRLVSVEMCLRDLGQEYKGDLLDAARSLK